MVFCIMPTLRKCLGKYLKVRVLVYVTLTLVLINILKYLQNRNRSEPMMMFHKFTSDQKIDASNAPFRPKNFQKVDWHDKALMRHDSYREGLGEQGKPAKTFINSTLNEKLYSANGFNAALSDKILLNRSLPDIRHPKCIRRKYLKSLPSVSVIVPFHNEHWSTLLRTIYSVIGRSPEHLLKEVFIVDDASTKEFLKKDLDDYIKANFTKVKLVRLPRRSGLISARLAGAKHVTSDVMIFLDSHTEANVNWLPPLLEPIALNYKTVVCPLVDIIDYETFEYRTQDEGARGGFDWEFFYKRLPITQIDVENMPDPFPSPVMAGGLFAISRHFFYELGGYDPELDIWGGEQYEISFKIWQCGGELLDAPCSRVGHIYRKFAPFPDPQHGDFVGKNYRRVAEVWMDEYAKYLYDRRPHYRDIDPGDLTQQKALRKRLKCKSFKWYMTQIAFDIEFMYPPIEPPSFAEGRIRPISQSICADAGEGHHLGNVSLQPCFPSDYPQQKFVLTWRNEIKCETSNMCWDLPDARELSPIVLYGCHHGGGNQEWKYHLETKKIVHGVGDKCVEWNETGAIYINWCTSEGSQEWTFDNLNVKELRKPPRIKPSGPNVIINE